MSSLLLPPIVILDQAAAQLADEASADSARLRALNKAQYALHQGISIVPVVGGFLIPSFDQGGVIYRVSTVNGCDCKAGQSGKPCKHTALIEIIEAAQTRAITLPDRIAARRRAAYEKALAEVDELYA
jgi:hypothetical protein